MIDQGRKPSFRYPPLQEIEKWIKVKPIRFRNERGQFVKQPSLRSMAFLIARSIKEKGYSGINFLTKAEDEVINKLEELGEQAAQQYFQNLIEEGLIIVK
jgi:isocitrate dehydrogenase